MTTPFWCLLIAVVLPYLLAFSGASFRAKLPGGLDNRNPRQQVIHLEGVGARFYAAQQNAWEALAVFTAAVLVAYAAGADAEKSAVAAIGFIAARIAHAVFYVADLDKLRSLSFVVGFGCCIWLFVLAARAT